MTPNEGQDGTRDVKDAVRQERNAQGASKRKKEAAKMRRKPETRDHIRDHQGHLPVIAGASKATFSDSAIVSKDLGV